jgi:hypothetical protein
VSHRLSALGPNVLGATGGSGTRAFARILERAGMFIGTNLNASEDAIDFGSYSDRWIDTFVGRRHHLSEFETAMRDDLSGVLDRHLLHYAGGRWGWKEPRSIFLLPFFDRCMPSLRFLHVVRDGRDMAFSSNQNQLRKHGWAFGIKGAGPSASIALWNRLNVETARYGEEVLGARYLRLRFEDLCAEPSRTAERVVDFFELTGGDPFTAAAEVVPPDTIGRWRREDSAVLAELHRVAAPGLTRFGYDHDS